MRAQTGAMHNRTTPYLDVDRVIEQRLRLGVVVGPVWQLARVPGHVHVWVPIEGHDVERQVGGRGHDHPVEVVRALGHDVSVGHPGTQDEVGRVGGGHQAEVGRASAVLGQQADDVEAVGAVLAV
jgi:hypothetical protein